MFDFQPIFLASMIVAQNVSEVSLPYGWLRDSARTKIVQVAQRLCSSGRLFKRKKHYIGPSLRQLNGKKQTNKQISNDFLICIMQLLGVIF